jgi:hypothetical protein
MLASGRELGSPLCAKVVYQSGVCVGVREVGRRRGLMLNANLFGESCDLIDKTLRQGEQKHVSELALNNSRVIQYKRS